MTTHRLAAAVRNQPAHETLASAVNIREHIESMMSLEDEDRWLADAYLELMS